MRPHGKVRGGGPKSRAIVPFPRRAGQTQFQTGQDFNPVGRGIGGMGKRPTSQGRKNGWFRNFYCGVEAKLAIFTVSSSRQGWPWN